MTDERPDVPVDDDPSAPGCRDLAVITGFVLVSAAVLFAIGLSLVNREGCSGACEFFGLAALYAGGPISGVLGIAFGGLHVAWPLDITLWVVVGYRAARLAGRRGWSPWTTAVVIVLVALGLGLVLSQFVELDLTER